jgi:hypothetical protein
MFRVMFTNGSVSEVPRAVSAALDEGGSLACRDESGNVVARFDGRTVTAYGVNDAILAAGLDRHRESSRFLSR